MSRARRGTIEAGALGPTIPTLGGWYGLKKGLQGRFGNDVPPVLEVPGPAEVEHQPRNDRMSAT